VFKHLTTMLSKLKSIGSTTSENKQETWHKPEDMTCSVCGKSNPNKHQDFCKDLCCSGRMVKDDLEVHRTPKPIKHKYSTPGNEFECAKCGCSTDSGVLQEQGAYHGEWFCDSCHNAYHDLPYQYGPIEFAVIDHSVVCQCCGCHAYALYLTDFGAWYCFNCQIFEDDYVIWGMYG
jgi:hypothetical protein